MLSREEKDKKIKAAFWDYNIEPHNIYLIVLGKREEKGFFTREKILVRLIETLSWYELIDLFGIEFLVKNMGQSIIAKIRNPEIRVRYESARKILQGEAISDSGWSDKNRERLKASLLSDRWYRP